MHRVWVTVKQQVSDGVLTPLTEYHPPANRESHHNAANIASASLPHGPPAARTGTSGQVLPADSRISERTPGATRTQTQNHASGMCDGKVADLRRRINTVDRITPAS